LVRAADC